MQAPKLYTLFLILLLYSCDHEQERINCIYKHFNLKIPDCYTELKDRSYDVEFDYVIILEMSFDSECFKKIIEQKDHIKYTSTMTSENCLVYYWSNAPGHETAELKIDYESMTLYYELNHI